MRQWASTWIRCITGSAPFVFGLFSLNWTHHIWIQIWLNLASLDLGLNVGPGWLGLSQIDINIECMHRQNKQMGGANLRCICKYYLGIVKLLFILFNFSKIIFRAIP